MELVRHQTNGTHTGIFSCLQTPESQLVSIGLDWSTCVGSQMPAVLWRLSPLIRTISDACKWIITLTEKILMLDLCAFEAMNAQMAVCFLFLHGNACLTASASFSPFVLLLTL